MFSACQHGGDGELTETLVKTTQTPIIYMQDLQVKESRLSTQNVLRLSSNKMKNNE